MYKKAVVFASLFLLAAFLLLLPLFRFEKKDLACFDKLVKGAGEKKGGMTYSESERSHVVKEIWFSEKERLHLRMTSEESSLFFFQQGKGVEVVEQLAGVNCLCQERLFFEGEKAMQEVRQVIAKKACYNYNTQLFVGEDVFLAKFHLEGHTLPLSVEGISPLMQGKAESVEFVLKGEKPELHAHHFQATFEPKKRGV